MLGHEILELLGASSLIVIILSVFWKGDDAVSPEFRADISEWLLRLKPPKANSPVGTTVMGLFVRVFGPRHWTLRCFAASCLVSWLTFAFCYLYFFVTEERYFDSDFGLNVIGTGGVLTFFLIINPVIDYLSLFCTRFIIQKVADGKLPVLVTIIVDFLASYFSYLIIFGLTAFAVLSFDPVYLRSVLDALSQHNFVEVPPVLQNQIGVFIAIVLVSSYVSSMWLWAAALSTLVIRVLSRSAKLISTLQYVLPVSEKPVRSMGIVAFLLCLAGMIGVSMASWVSGLI